MYLVATEAGLDHRLPNQPLRSGYTDSVPQKMPRSDVSLRSRTQETADYQLHALDG